MIQVTASDAAVPKCITFSEFYLKITCEYMPPFQNIHCLGLNDIIWIQIVIRNMFILQQGLGRKGRLGHTRSAVYMNPEFAYLKGLRGVSRAWKYTNVNSLANIVRKVDVLGLFLRFMQVFWDFIVVWNNKVIHLKQNNLISSHLLSLSIWFDQQM